MSTLISKNIQLESSKASIIIPGLEMVGIINKKGRLIDSIGAKPFTSPQRKKEMFLMGIALQSSMQRDFDEDFGEVNYNVTQRENLKIISIPTCNGQTILAVAKKNIDYENVVAGINQLLQYSDQFLGEIISKKKEP